MNTKLEHQYIRIALIFGIAAASMAASTALAGRNANGALIVHTDDTYSYSTDTACTTPLGNPGTCTGAVTQTNKTSGTVIWVLASFPAGSSPGVSALQFGIQYDASLLNPVLAHGACGFFPQEVSTPDWPAPCSGTAFVYAAPTYANPFACYVFEVDNSCDRPGAWFSTTVHPGTNEAKFWTTAILPWRTCAVASARFAGSPLDGTTVRGSRVGNPREHVVWPTEPAWHCRRASARIEGAPTGRVGRTAAGSIAGSTVVRSPFGDRPGGASAHRTARGSTPRRSEEGRLPRRVESSGCAATPELPD